MWTNIRSYSHEYCFRLQYRIISVSLSRSFLHSRFDCLVIGSSSTPILAWRNRQYKLVYNIPINFYYLLLTAIYSSKASYLLRCTASEIRRQPRHPLIIFASSIRSAFAEWLYNLLVLFKLAALENYCLPNRWLHFEIDFQEYYCQGCTKNNYIILNSKSQQFIFFLYVR